MSTHRCWSLEMSALGICHTRRSLTGALHHLNNTPFEGYCVFAYPRVAATTFQTESRSKWLGFRGVAGKTDCLEPAIGLLVTGARLVASTQCFNFFFRSVHHVA